MDQVPRFNEDIDALSVKKSSGPKSIMSFHSKQSSRSIIAAAANGRPTTSGHQTIPVRVNL
jgi:hypothetical protein